MNWFDGSPKVSGWYWLDLGHSIEVCYFNSLWGLQIQGKPQYIRATPSMLFSGPIFPPERDCKKADVLEMQSALPERPKA